MSNVEGRIGLRTVHCHCIYLKCYCVQHVEELLVTTDVLSTRDVQSQMGRM